MANGPDVVVYVDITDEVEWPVDTENLERAVVQALQCAGRDGSRAPQVSSATVEVSIRITADREMQALNREYRGVDKPTDVLSFSFIEPDDRGPAVLPAGMPVQLGEIVLSYPYVLRQAAELDHSVPKELAWLTIHGTLQLLGYTHDSDSDAEHMELLEQETLRDLGFTES